MKKSTSSLTSCQRYCNDIANQLFWELQECLTTPIKNNRKSIRKKLSGLYACKKSTSSQTSFFRYCKEIASLLFWVLSACLTTHPQSDTNNLQKTFVSICWQKINFISFSSLLRYYILKNPAIWLANSILVHNLRARI